MNYVVSNINNTWCVMKLRTISSIDNEAYYEVCIQDGSVIASYDKIKNIVELLNKAEEAQTLEATISKYKDMLNDFKMAVNTSREGIAIRDHMTSNYLIKAADSLLEKTKALEGTQ